MKAIVNKLLLAGVKFMLEIHLKHLDLHIVVAALSLKTNKE